MKPIRLSFEGLNSYEEKQSIDFSSFCGSFGVFGKTGSGKSTILDAITLALYGKINRENSTKSFINTKRKKAVVSLEFEEVVKRKVVKYKIVRTFENDEAVDLSSCQLFVFDGNDWFLICEDEEKVSSEIFSITNMGYAEFSKCIALPQGEFSAFLKADKNERIKIMSKIFGTQEYGEKLTKKIQAKYDSLSEIIASLDASLKMVLYADDDALLNKKEEFLKVTSDYEETKAKLKQKKDEFGESTQAFEKKSRLVVLSKTIDELEKEAEQMKTLEGEISKHEIANQTKADFEKLQKMVQDESELSNKLSELNESKLKSSSDLYESQVKFEELKRVHDEKLIELKTKLSKFGELRQIEKELAKDEESLAGVQSNIDEKQKELQEYQEKLDYIQSQSIKLEDEIKEIGEFIVNNQPDSGICFALEQTKGIESELILINDFCCDIEKLIDQTNEDIKAVQEEYNSLVKEESTLNKQVEQISNSIEVSFEDYDDTPFKKLRSCDDQVFQMESVTVNVEAIDNNIEQLNAKFSNNENRLKELSDEIDKYLYDLAEIDKYISSSEIDINKTREFREELLGENILSILSNHLPVGNSCPVCGNVIMQKMYCEVNDLKPIESDIDSKLTNQKTARFEKEKIIKSLASSRALFEYISQENEIIYAEINSLKDSKNRLYQNFVNATDSASEDFERLKEIVLKTSSSLENLILLQDNLQLAKERTIVAKTVAGTKLFLYKNQVESLIDILYGLQKKKAERELAIYDANEKNKDLAAYQKQIAEGKTVYQLIESKKYQREELRDSLHNLDVEKAELQGQVSKISAELLVLNEKKDNLCKLINHSKSTLLTSGVPEGVSVDQEEIEINKLMAKIDFDLETSESNFESNKEYLNRLEKEYEIKNSVLLQKRVEISNLEKLMDDVIVENGFKDRDELKGFFISQNELRTKQNTLTNYSTAVRVATIQKKELENNELKNYDEDELKSLKLEIEDLESLVEKQSQKVGFVSSELEKFEKDNEIRQKLLEDISNSKEEFETTKQLLNVLLKKSFDGFMIDKYLQEITFVANKKLSYLIDGKYDLFYKNEEFYVKDNFSSEKVRPVSTLSGGETFLVSLSLALSINEAISEISMKKLNFFFLDEGFGTLDNETIEIFASVISKLDSQNLMVGLITHSTQLEEILKNRVYVEKTQNGSRLKTIFSL